MGGARVLMDNVEDSVSRVQFLDEAVYNSRIINTHRIFHYSPSSYG